MLIDLLAEHRYPLKRLKSGQVDTSGAKPLLKAAYEAGVNFFDNAEACSCTN